MTLLLGFGAVNTGNNLIYLLVSALLGFMVISGILGKRNLDGLQVRLRFADEIYDGHPTLVGVELTNGRRLLPAQLIDVQLAAEPGSVLFPLVPAGEQEAGRLLLTLTGRGPHSFSAILLNSRYPINFFVRSRYLPIADRCVVFPAPQPCPLPAASSGRQLADERAASQRGHEGDIDRIHEYQPGDPLRRIHWRLSARHDQLKVKDLAAAASEPLWVDPRECPGASLEEKLRCAVYLINQGGRAERPVGLRLPGQRLAPATGRPHRLKLLHHLAGYGKN